MVAARAFTTRVFPRSFCLLPARDRPRRRRRVPRHRDARRVASRRRTMSLDARQRCVFEAKLAEQAEAIRRVRRRRRNPRTIDDERSFASRRVFETREKRDGIRRVPIAAPERARDGRRETNAWRETDGSTTGTRRCRTQSKCGRCRALCALEGVDALTTDERNMLSVGVQERDRRATRVVENLELDRGEGSEGRGHEAHAGKGEGVSRARGGGAEGRVRRRVGGARRGGC